MIKFFDNGRLYGWYYTTDGCVFGDGTIETAKEIKNEWSMYL